jgi:hypothetical protein
MEITVYTENLFTESMSHRLVFDKTVAVKQLHVVEAHGILLFRADKGNLSNFLIYFMSTALNN